MNLWEKLFGSAHVMFGPTVNKILKKIIENYYNKVCIKVGFFYAKLQWVYGWYPKLCYMVFTGYVAIFVCAFWRKEKDKIAIIVMIQ